MEREKRVSPRVSFETGVTVTSGDWEWKAKSIDISIGGMFLSSNRFPKIGSVVYLIFNIKGDDVKVKSFVQWATPKGFGVRFNILGVKLTHAINNL